MIDALRQHLLGVVVAAVTDELDGVTLPLQTVGVEKKSQVAVRVLEERFHRSVFPGGGHQVEGEFIFERDNLTPPDVLAMRFENDQGGVALSAGHCRGLDPVAADFLAPGRESAAKFTLIGGKPDADRVALAVRVSTLTRDLGYPPAILASQRQR